MPEMEKGCAVAKRLTDKKKKLMVADYAEMGSYCAVARKHKVSATTVKKIVLNDPQSVEECNKKKEQNTLDMISFMESRKDKAQTFIDMCLDTLVDPEKLNKAQLQQVTTAMGTVVDKFTGITAAGTVEKLNDNLESVKEMLRNTVPNRGLPDE